MKKLFTAIVAVAAMAMFTSCEQDAPEINFSQTDTHISDFSKLIAALDSQAITIETKLQLINDAIDAHSCNNYDGGIYRLPDDPNALYMNPSIWEAIKGDPELVAAILSTLSEPVINITQLFPVGHNTGHLITYDRTSLNTSELSSTLATIQVGGVNQMLIKVYKKLIPEIATYTLFRGSTCGLFFGEVFITDARGTYVERYNGKGTATSIADVDIYFEDSGNVVTSVSVTANMVD